MPKALYWSAGQCESGINTQFFAKTPADLHPRCGQQFPDKSDFYMLSRTRFRRCAGSLQQV